MRRRLAGRTWPVVLAALRVAAEAGWITVVYAAAAVLINRSEPVLGPIEFSALVAGGVVIGRFARARPEIGAVVLIVGVMVGGALGWAASPDVQGLLPSLPRALGLHLAGWLGGIAVIRGALVSTGERAAQELEGMMRTVPVGLGLVWAYTTFAVRSGLWLPFAVSAMWGTVLFLSASLVAIGMARLNVLHGELRDTRQKRAWRWLVAGVGFGIVPVAVPLAILGGIPLSALMTPVVGPIQWLFGLLTIPLSWIVWLLSEILRPVAPGVGALLDLVGQAIGRRGRPQPEETSALGFALGILLVVITVGIVLFAIFYFARWLLMRRQLVAHEFDAGVSQVEREIVLPARDPKPAAAQKRPRRKGTPHDVVAAYVAALAELERDPTFARLPAETPAQHALRIQRADGPAAPDLARLAAGYQLARYGARRIGVFENLRALGRFQRIKRAIRS